MVAQEFDLCVIGGGKAGFAAARYAVESGRSVAIVEEAEIGGTCVNRGCMPSKNLASAADVVYQCRNHGFEGIRADVTDVDLVRIVRQKDMVIDRIREMEFGSFLKESPKSKLFQGHGMFLDENTVEVDGKRIYSESFVICSGSRPGKPSIPGLEGVDYLDSTSLMNLSHLPRSMVALVGGHPQMELPQAFSRLGSRMIMLVKDTPLLRMAEPEITQMLAGILRDEGIDVHMGSEALDVRQMEKGILLSFDVDGETRMVEADSLYVDLFRTPNTNGMGLEEIGVDMDERGFIEVNEQMQTSVPHIYAAGDCTRDMLIDPVAEKEGWIAGMNLLDGEGMRMSYEDVPVGYWTEPQIGMVGLTEKQAREQGYQVVSHTLPMQMIGKAVVSHQARGMIKIVANPEDGKILGLHLLAPNATEIINHAACLIRHGATVEEAAKGIMVHPTISNSIRAVARGLMEARKKMIPAVM